VWLGKLAADSGCKQNRVKTCSPFSIRQMRLVQGTQDTREELQNASMLKYLEEVI